MHPTQKRSVLDKYPLQDSSCVTFNHSKVPARRKYEETEIPSTAIKAFYSLFARNPAVATHSPPIGRKFRGDKVLIQRKTVTKQL